MVRIGTVVMGVVDMHRAVEFWTRALNYVPRDQPEQHWAVLQPADGGPGVQLALGLSESPVQKYPRVHLDLYVDTASEQVTEVERLVGLGAALVDWDRYPEDPDFVVLADPEGNRFCVIDASHG